MSGTITTINTTVLQQALDDAYDQAKYAPNLPQILKRYASNSDIARAHLGAPRRIADVYGGRGSMRLLLARRFPAADIETFELLQSVDRGHGARGRLRRACL